MLSYPRRWPRALLAAVTTVASVTLAVAAPSTAQAAVIPASDYQQVKLATGSAELGEAMSLAVLPNRSVLHTARNGVLRVTDVAGNTKVSGTLSVYTHDEEGLQGVAVDPNFATNRWIYLYYSPPLSTPSGDAPTTGSQSDWDRWKGHLRLSRFTLNSDDTLNLGTEKIVLQVATTVGSAATWAVTWTSTPPATCT